MALNLAKREAEFRGDDSWGPAHVLLSLIWNGDAVLAEFGVAEDIRHRLDLRMGSPQYAPEPEELDELLILAPQAVYEFGGNEVDAKHFLLAMTQLRRGVVAEVLAELELVEPLGRRLRELLA